MSKKVDVSYMKFVETDDEWKREITEGGGKQLCIVDVYTKLWGPCDMIAGHFGNYYFDMGEEYGMKFVRACSDKIGALKEFRDASQPTFVFYLNGELQETIAGPDIPKILDTIKGKAPKNEVA